MGLHIPNLNPDKVLDKSAEQNCRKILNVKMQPWIYPQSFYHNSQHKLQILEKVFSNGHTDCC